MAEWTTTSPGETSLGDASALSADAVLDRIRRRRPKEPRPDADAQLQRAYRRAAAVLVSFEPGALQPVDARGYTVAVNQGSNATTEAARLLAGDSAVVHESAETYESPQWFLTLDVRCAALADFESREARRLACGANVPRIRTPLQDMFTACLAGKVPALEGLDLDGLNCLLQIGRWLNGIERDFPDHAQLVARMRREQMLAPARFLLRDGFSGRTGELAALREYAAPRDLLDRIVVGTQSIFGHDPDIPAVLYGPGGVGKSTLLARFIANHLAPAGAGTTIDLSRGRVGIVYLDFDVPSLRPAEPLTILLEAAWQLSSQYPSRSAPLDDFAERLTKRLASRVDAPQTSLKGDAASEPSSIPPDQPSAVLPPERLDWAKEFASAIAPERNHPLRSSESILLFAIDTFELVQYSGPDNVDQLFEFLRDLRRACGLGGLRVVIAGRTEVESGRRLVRNVELMGLSDTDAADLLQHEGVTNPEVARLVVRQIGGNPLSLKLAVALIKREGITGDRIRDLQTRRAFFFRMNEALIQGQLYRRILQHVRSADKRVKALVSPGLIVRRISPEVILNVLAPACGIKVEGLADARGLLEELKRESFLVSPVTGETNVVRHRSDVRQVMLKLLRQEQGETARVIHTRAVEYYASLAGSAARAEELYHRLCLDQPRHELEARWDALAGNTVAESIDELPNRGQAYLAAKLGRNRPDEVWAEADPEDWEQYAIDRVTRLLASGRAERAIDILTERADITRLPGSRLHIAEAQAWFQVGRTDMVADAAVAAARAALERNDPPGYVDALRLRADALAKQKQFAAAERELVDVEEFAAVNVPDLLVDVRLHRLQMRRYVGGQEAQGLVELRDRLADAYRQFDPKTLANRPATLWCVAIELGEERQEVLADAIAYAGLPPRSDLEQLGKALGTADDQFSRQQGSEPGVLAQELGVAREKDVWMTWQRFATSVDPVRQRELLVKLLSKFSLPEIARKLFIEFLRMSIPDRMGAAPDRVQRSSGPEEMNTA